MEKQTPYQIWKDQGYMAVQRALINDPKSIHNSTSKTPSLLAGLAFYGNYLNLKGIVDDFKPDLNVVDKYNGSTPLHFAVFSEKSGPEQEKIVTYLIKKGANPYVKSSKSRTCFDPLEDGRKPSPKIVKLMRSLTNLGSFKKFLDL